MTRKQKVMEALLGEAPLTSLSGEDILWVESYIPNADQNGNIVSEGFNFKNISVDHNKEIILDCLGVDKDIEEKMLKKYYPDGLDTLSNFEKYSEFTQTSIKNITSEEIIFMFSHYLRSLEMGLTREVLFKQMFKGLKDE